MKLTVKETRLVERLRMFDRQWRYTRWALLVVGVAFIAMWAWMLHYVFQSAAESRDQGAEALLHAYAYPKVLFGMVMGAVAIGFALRDWSGSPTRTLLLRLLEEHQAQPDPPPGSGPAESSGSSGARGGPPSAS